MMNSQLHKIFTLCFLLLGWGLAMAQPPTNSNGGASGPGGGGTEENSMVVDLQEDGGTGGGRCHKIMEVELKVTNLVENPTVGMAYSLPTGVEPMFIQYELDGIAQGTLQATDFTFLGDYVNGYPLFVSKCSTSVNIENFCDTAYNPEGGTAPSTNYSSLLVTGTGDRYPVEDYAEEDEVFSCSVFRVNRNNCGLFVGDPIDSPTSIGSTGSLSVPCVDCVDQFTGTSERSSELENDLQATIFSLNVSPIPFREQLLLQYQNPTTKVVQMAIYSVNGQLLWQSRVQGEQSDYIQLQTAKWDSGLYFLELRDGEKVQHQKLIKVY